MNARRAATPGATAPAGGVVELDERRILQALARRERYKYVQPRLERDGRGWKVASPNCSRNVFADGREIDIARLVPDNLERTSWKLYARDHVLGAWIPKAGPAPLPQVLALLATDPSREFWP